MGKLVVRRRPAHPHLSGYATDRRLPNPGVTVKTLPPPRTTLAHVIARALFLAIFGAAAATTLAQIAPGAAPLSTERIAAIIASPDRSAADRTNDVRRKPAEMLAFIGIVPGMIAMDLSSGGGYTTELLARAVGPAGRVYGQSAPRNAPPPPPPAPEGAAYPSAQPAPPPAATAPAASTPAAPMTTPMRLAERAKNPAAGNIVSVVQKFEDPFPAAVAANGVDLVTLMFNYHDLGHMGVDRAQMNKAVFAALKRGGMYVIADHSGRPVGRP